jgi:hypothetical protein
MKNTMTVGIILTILGICTSILGISIIFKNRQIQPETKTVESFSQEFSDTKSDKEKGDDFEKYVVQKFSKSYFSVLEWTGDKFVNGTYAQSNRHPDFTLKFKMKDVDVDFSVECKYRSDYYKNGVEWCSNKQMEFYKSFAEAKKRPVFVVIGLGGKPASPEELFIVPLSEMKNTFVHKSFLLAYKKENFKESNLFYDYQSGRLK